jgi:hypothetical protein
MMTRRYTMKDEPWAKIEDLLPGRAGSIGVILNPDHKIDLVSFLIWLA